MTKSVQSDQHFHMIMHNKIASTPFRLHRISHICGDEDLYNNRKTDENPTCMKYDRALRHGKQIINDMEVDILYLWQPVLCPLWGHSASHIFPQ